MAKIVRLILTEELRGAGTKADPFRRICQLYSLDGNLVAEVDPEIRDKRTGDGENTMELAGVIFEPWHIK